MSHNGHKLKLKEILKATGAKTWKEAVVRFGYGDMFGLEPGQFYDFIVRLGTPEEIMQIIPIIESYNAFEGEPIAEMLAELLARGTLMYVEFGREGSPVLRVFMRNAENNRAIMMELLKKFSPDELDEFGPYAIRAWWD